MNARGIDFTGIAYLVILAAGGYAVYRVVKGVPTVQQAVTRAGTAIREAAGAAVDAVTPTNPNNIFNRAFQPIADLFIGTDPDRKDGGQLLAQITSTWEQDDAAIGAQARLLARRGEVPSWSAADQDDADLGRAMAEISGAAYVNYSHLTRGVFK